MHDPSVGRGDDKRCVQLDCDEFRPLVAADARRRPGGPIATEQRLDRSAETGPKSHLAGDGSASYGHHRAGPEHQIVTQL